MALRDPSPEKSKVVVLVKAGAKGAKAAKTSVTALAYRRAGAFATLILGHGAGADQRHPFLVGIARRLRDRGVDVVTYNFIYTEKKRRLPDRNDALEACTRAVLAAVSRDSHDSRNAHGPVFLGGKSMGGRIASQVAAGDAQTAIAGLVFLGYPLHPPGRPEKMRDAHLGSVEAPMLFVQGERDAFGTPAELAPLVKRLKKAGKRADVHVVGAGDHSLGVPKRGGVSQEAIYDGVADVIASWMKSVTSS